MTFDPFTYAGIAGAALLVAAYFANQVDWLKSEDWRYPLANLLGALLIMVSLITAWNLAALVMECFWSAVSVYGLIKQAGRSVRT
jgi:hypothetical protein